MSSYNVRDMEANKVEEVFNTFIINRKEVSIYDDKYTVTLYNKSNQFIILKYYDNLKLGDNIKLEFIPKVENLRFDGYLYLNDEKLLAKVKGFIAHCLEYDPIKYIARGY